MSDPLVTYVEDHLAGARYAIELLAAIREQHAGEPMADFAENMLVEVKADSDILEQLTAKIGGNGTLKQLSAWVTEKVSRIKLRRDANSGLGTFEALEFLALGILGKLSLWRALAVIQPGDPRLENLDLLHLAKRAEQQHSQVETKRLEAAIRELRPVPECTISKVQG